ncbi:MAG: mechanosensitive ion channel domain-containing protein [archaeon]
MTTAEQKVKSLKIKIYVTLISIFLCFIVFIYWFKCGGICKDLFSDWWSIILSETMPFLKKLMVVIGIFIFFKIFEHIILKVVLKKIFTGLELGERYKKISRLITFVWWIIFGLIAISILIGNVVGLLTSLGLIGFGLTFALQKPILNFVGWLTILFKDTYSEGDRIKVGGVRGDVKEIQVMNTVLDGLLENSDLRSGKVVTFPNELVLTSEVENYTKDSNYIVEELGINITYESDYNKARALLRQIIVEQIKKNKTTYIKKIYSQKKKIDQFINKLLKKKVNTKKEDDDLKREAEMLKKEKEQIDTNIKELEEEFKPKIRVEMLDSSIQLIAQFFTPYNHIKKNRTEIHLAFLDAIRNDPDIEIAYPHMQIVPHERKKQKIRKS